MTIRRTFSQAVKLTGLQPAGATDLIPWLQGAYEDVGVEDNPPAQVENIALTIMLGTPDGVGHICSQGVHLEWQWEPMTRGAGKSAYVLSIEVARREKPRQVQHAKGTV